MWIPANHGLAWMKHKLRIHSIGERMRYFRNLCLTVLMMALTGTLAQAQKPSGYKVSRRITLGGEG